MIPCIRIFHSQRLGHISSLSIAKHESNKDPLTFVSLRIHPSIAHFTRVHSAYTPSRIRGITIPSWKQVNMGMHDGLACRGVMEGVFVHRRLVIPGGGKTFASPILSSVLIPSQIISIRCHDLTHCRQYLNSTTGQ